MASSGIAFALTTGAVAAFNPCGFAMLPAYLASFVSTDQGDSNLARRILRAAKVGAAVTAGFVAVFGSIGFLLQELSNAVRSVIPFVTAIIGVGLVVLGVAMLFGYQPKFAMPRVQTDTSSKDTKAMFLYGVSYATVSLSCTLPLFLTQVVRNAQREGILSGMVNYVAYAAGMGLIVITLTVAVALAQQGFVRNMRRVLPYINKAAAVLLILAGSYVAYYGWFERQIMNSSGEAKGGGLADWMFRQSGKFSTWVEQHNTVVFLVGLVVVGIVAAAVVLRPKPSPDTTLATSQLSPTDSPIGQPATKQGVSP
jgi:cytochrome c-type biogenesis protein